MRENEWSEARAREREMQKERNQLLNNKTIRESCIGWDGGNAVMLDDRRRECTEAS